ncbi:DPP IV N-terminal domain-containing protein [Sphingomonas sp. ID0503]|uniref:S9 family peptidase n=1 Tax=Sphingomonas sp. ID0503 TaxID=3399691 RepID=UPI003AFA5F1F
MKLSILMLAALMTSTTAPAADLTLERVFASPSLSGPSPRLAKLSPDGKLATLLRNRAEDADRYDLWAIDTTTGKARMLVDSAKIGTGAALSEEEKMRRERLRIGNQKGIVDYDWAPDGKSLLVPIDGDLYVADLAGRVRRLTTTEATEVDAHVSDAGKYVSFVRDQNLFVIDLASGRETALTTDGGGTLAWGTAEFVAQEEMDRHEGHWWSPDDTYVAVQRTDESKVAVVTRTAIGADGTKVFDQRYPLAGTANAAVELWVIDPATGKRVKVDLGANPDVYLARVDWSKDGSVLYVQRESRDQQRLDLFQVDPSTGKSGIVLTETSKTWIDLNNGFHALKDGGFLWMSERSGYAHLYRWKDGTLTQLTSGDWIVDDVAGVDEAGGKAYVLGTLDSPLEKHLYAVDIARPGKPMRVTEAGWWNEAKMDKGATRALITRSNPDQPTQVYLADATGRRVTWIEENRLDARHPYTPYLASHAETQFGTLTAADGSTLHYKLLSPKRVAGRRYPVFVQVYGGPAGQQVSRQWGKGTPLQQYLVDKGWIVFSIDNRGTPRRGNAFEDQIFKAGGTVEIADQKVGLDWLKAQPFVDPAKIAVYGWSYGGYMTLKLLEKLPGQYAAGISGAPVTRWELYDTHYTERYMGNPKTDPQSYASADALPEAEKIADPLLILHGMADDNVTFDNTTAFISRLQDHAVPFEMMAYPGKTHAVAGEMTNRHLWGTIERFLDAQVLKKAD